MAGPGRNWRRTVKTALASASRVPVSVLTRPMQPYVVGYHRVVEDFESEASRTLPAMLVSTAMFERQLDWIGAHFRFVTLDEIGDHLRSGRPFDGPVAAVTFDDGYRDVYEHACPILRRKGIPATFFVVTGLVERSGWQIFDRLYRILARSFAPWSDAAARAPSALAALGLARAAAAVIRDAAGPEAATGQLLTRVTQADVVALVERLEDRFGSLDEAAPPLLSWDAVRDLRRQGFAIASHTETHAWLPVESRDRVVRELGASRAALERHLGEPVRHFAYPAGFFTSAVVRDVEHAGYETAYSICGHRDAERPHLTVPRELIWEHSATDGRGRFAPALMACRVRGLFSGMSGCRQAHA